MIQRLLGILCDIRSPLRYCKLLPKGGTDSPQAVLQSYMRCTSSVKACHPSSTFPIPTWGLIGSGEEHGERCCTVMGSLISSQVFLTGGWLSNFWLFAGGSNRQTFSRGSDWSKYTTLSFQKHSTYQVLLNSQETNAFTLWLEVYLRIDSQSLVCADNICSCNHSKQSWEPPSPLSMKLLTCWAVEFRCPFHIQLHIPEQQGSWYCLTLSHLVLGDPY